MITKCRIGMLAVLSVILITLPGFVTGTLGGKPGNDPFEYWTSDGKSAQAQPTGQYIVKLNGKSDNFAKELAKIGGRISRDWSAEIGVVEVTGLDYARVSKLARLPGVQTVDQDLVVQWIPSASDLDFNATTSDELAGQTDQSGATFFPAFQWNLRQVAADTAWINANQGLGARVAILDTGIDPTHQDLVGKFDLASSTSCISTPLIPGDLTINDFNWHGTFVSSQVATNGIAMASVAPDSTMIGVKVLRVDGSGTFGDVLCGIIHSVNVGADVVNMSLLATFPKRFGLGGLNGAVTRAMNFAHRNGVLLVGAAGNSATDTNIDKDVVHVPAQSSENVMSVGATGPTGQANFDQLATYTNFNTSGVDLMAPGGNFTGVDIRDGILGVCSRFSLVFPACVVDGFYLIGGNGTSFAAPHVSGTAAVVESQFAGDQNPARLRHCILTGADDLGKRGVDSQYSHGRLNVMGAAGC